MVPPHSGPRPASSGARLLQSRPSPASPGPHPFLSELRRFRSPLLPTRMALTPHCGVTGAIAEENTL